MVGVFGEDELDDDGDEGAGNQDFEHEIIEGSFEERAEGRSLRGLFVVRAERGVTLVMVFFVLWNTFVHVRF